MQSGWCPSPDWPSKLGQVFGALESLDLMDADDDTLPCLQSVASCTTLRHVELQEVGNIELAVLLQFPSLKTVACNTWQACGKLHDSDSDSAQPATCSWSAVDTRNMDVCGGQRPNILIPRGLPLLRFSCLRFGSMASATEAAATVTEAVSHLMAAGARPEDGESRSSLTTQCGQRPTMLCWKVWPLWLPM